MVWCVWLWKLKIAFSPAHKWYLNHKQLFSCHHLHKSQNEPNFHSIFSLFHSSLWWHCHEWFYEILVLNNVPNEVSISKDIDNSYQYYLSFKNNIFSNTNMLQSNTKYCSIQQPLREQQFLKNVIVCTWKCYFGLIDSCNWLILFQ